MDEILTSFSCVSRWHGPEPDDDDDAADDDESAGRHGAPAGHDASGPAGYDAPAAAPGWHASAGHAPAGHDAPRPARNDAAPAGNDAAAAAPAGDDAPAGHDASAGHDAPAGDDAPAGNDGWPNAPVSHGRTDVPWPAVSWSDVPRRPHVARWPHVWPADDDEPRLRRPSVGSLVDKS